VIIEKENAICMMKLRPPGYKEFSFLIMYLGRGMSGFADWVMVMSFLHSSSCTRPNQQASRRRPPKPHTTITPQQNLGNEVSPSKQWLLIEISSPQNSSYGLVSPNKISQNEVGMMI